MTHVAIDVKNLSKRYRIGQPERYRTLRDTLTEAWNAPFRRLRRSPSCSRASDSGMIWALKDVSFEVRPGEVMGVIGRNGAGKTTLLKLLSRITEPTEGFAAVRGRVGSLLEVGTGFHPELTGRENVFLNGAILGMRTAEITRKFDAIVAFSEVERFLDTPVKHYSSGMYVRLAFAVAAHLEPEILLVDEVLAVGDAAFQKKCLGRMGNVASEGRTVLFVSHNMGAIESLCDRTIWLDGGQLRDVGSPEETVAAYLSAVTEGSLATQGLGVIQVRRVVLRNAKGQPTTIFHPGDDIDIAVHIFARQRVEKPYVWISINSGFGEIFAANMTLDGQLLNAMEGDDVIGCRFRAVPLLPQFYTVKMCVRQANSKRTLLESQEVAAFHVVGPLADFGLRGEQADIKARSAAPFFVPYEWVYPDGRRVAVQLIPNDGGSRASNGA